MPQEPLLDWREGQPVSRLYGDVYFSRTSGLNESRHVFLAQNRLSERWRDAALQRFAIGETGFGTGLNFLCAWALWEECAPPGAHLHYFSIEKHPLTRAELEQALALWPQLEKWRAPLMACYADPAPGWQRFEFANGRVLLTLAIGDIATELPQLDVAMDAWFLDGFAPARNPDMWSKAVLQQIAQRTTPGGSFATFTAAGDVRRALQEAGFEVEKVPGHGHKREMLRGALRDGPARPRAKAWYARPSFTSEKRALIIGGGIAGVCAAASLARRGWAVQLIERHPVLAAEASGNPLAMLYTRLSAGATPLRALILAGYAHTLRLLQNHDADFDPCGVLQLGFDAEETQRQRDLVQAGFPTGLLRGVDAAEASALAGLPMDFDGLYFSAGGALDPAKLCRALAATPGIEVRTATEALRLERDTAGWRLFDDSGCIAEAPVAVIAGALDSVRFAQTAHLPLKCIRGQLTSLQATPASAALRTVVCGEGYIAPARGGSHCLGATHKVDDRATDLRAAEHAENLAMLARLAPALYRAAHAQNLDPTALPGRAALRVSTPDYLPLVGPVADAEAFNRVYADLARDATLSLDTPAPWLQGLYVSTAHGSRGLISAPLAGELLAAYIEEETFPLPQAVVETLHPSRFLLRKLVRGASKAGRGT